MILSTLLRQVGAVALTLCVTAVHADSFTSSASSAGSASSASISDSLSASSDSSSDSDNDSSDSDNEQVANGDYRIMEVAEVADRPAMRRLTLEADDAPRRFQLDLPTDILKQERLQRGDRVHVQQRVYGLEFAHSDNREAFYLVLSDDWHDELAARPLLSSR